MFLTTGIALGSALGVTLSAFALPAQEPASEPVPVSASEEGFRFDMNLDAWFPRLVGDVAIVPGGPNVDVSDLDLNGSEVAFTGDARLTWDRCFVSVSGFAFDTDGQTPTLTSSANWWSLSADVGYALWTPFDNHQFPWSASEPRADNVAGDGAQRLSLAFAPTAGVSYDNLDIESTTIATGARNEIDGAWCAVRGGLALGLRLHTRDLVGFLDTIEIGAGLSAGPSFGLSGDAEGVGLLWTVDAGVRVLFTPNIGVHLGYKLVDGDFDEDRAGISSTADVGLQGLVAGLAIRF